MGLLPLDPEAIRYALIGAGAGFALALGDFIWGDFLRVRYARESHKDPDLPAWSPELEAEFRAGLNEGGLVSKFRPFLILPLLGITAAIIWYYDVPWMMEVAGAIFALIAILRIIFLGNSKVLEVGAPEQIGWFKRLQGARSELVAALLGIVVLVVSVDDFHWLAEHGVTTGWIIFASGVLLLGGSAILLRGLIAQRREDAILLGQGAAEPSEEQTMIAAIAAAMFLLGLVLLISGML